MSPREVRLRDLCALDPMAGAAPVGGMSGVDAVVRDVVVVQASTVLSAPIDAGTAIVLALDSPDAPPHREHLLDLVLRRAHMARAAAVLVLGYPGTVPAASARLADRVGVATLLVADGQTALDFAVELRSAVHAPAVAQSEMVRRLGRKLDVGLGAVLRALSAELRAPVSACTAHASVIAGPMPRTPMADILAIPALTSFRSDDTSVAVVPVAPAGTPALWLVAERDGVGALWRDTAELALAIAHGPVLAWLAREQLTAERDARLRSTLLTEIVEHGEAIAAAVAEQATTLGWQLGGWHIGVHFHFPADAQVSPFTLDSLLRDLTGAGITPGPLVERADGWSTWLTTPKAPPADVTHHVAKLLTEALRTFTARGPGVSVAAGLGSPQRDIPGIATTLNEARQAAVIAASSGEDPAVRVVQDLGATRLLLGWYSSSTFRDYAAQILRPLLDADEPELLSTLEAYLDRACSAMRTARVLGIHRNTVAQRIARAERILGTSLEQPDTRLALQLALRAARTSN